MRRGLKRCIHILFFFIVVTIKRTCHQCGQRVFYVREIAPKKCRLEKIIIGAEDEDDVALAKIDNLFFRAHRRVSNDDATATFKDSNGKRHFETKLSDLLEFDAGSSSAAAAPKWPVVREDTDEEADTDGIATSEVSPFMRFDPVDKDDEAEEEFADYADDEDSETRDATKNPRRMKSSKHAELAHRIGQKLIDRKTKFTISLPVAILAVGNIILLTCCCSLYLRNRLVACINTFPGRKRKKKSKMLAVDTERGRSTPRTRKRREKSLSFGKRRARSLSQDVATIGTQKSSATMTRDMEEPSTTTGCYRCCKKKKKHANTTNKR